MRNARDWGNCKIFDAVGNELSENSLHIGALNPFRWKGFYFDSESKLYYANGSYYDPETGTYLDAAPISTVIDNAFNPGSLDRNGLLCNNTVELASNPFTVSTPTELHPDLLYEPDYSLGVKIQNWFKPLIEWFNGLPLWFKVATGAMLIIISVAIAFATQGASIGAESYLLGASEATLASAAHIALTELVVGVGISVAFWAISSAINNDWSVDGLEHAVADSVFFTGVFMFISSSVNALKAVARGSAYPQPELAKVANYKQFLQFESREILEEHFAIHRPEFKGMYVNADEYLVGANNVIRNGVYISERNGYAIFYRISSKNVPLYHFVGLKNGGANISTYFIRPL